MTVKVALLPACADQVAPPSLLKWIVLPPAPPDAVIVTDWLFVFQPLAGPPAKA